MITTTVWSVAHLLSRQVRQQVGLELRFKQDPNAISDAVSWASGELPYEVRLKENTEKDLYLVLTAKPESWPPSRLAMDADFFAARTIPLGQYPVEALGAARDVIVEGVRILFAARAS